MSASIQVLSISLDFDKFQITYKEKLTLVAHSVLIQVTGSNNVSKGMFLLMYGYVVL